MYADTYHYLRTFTIVQDDLLNGQFPPAVLDQLRGCARSRFLQQLGAYTSELASEGLQLRIRGLTRSGSLDVAPGDIVAVTELLERLDDELVIAERVYAVTGGWAPLYQERIQVRIEDHMGQCRIPEPLQQAARRWVGFIRGLTPATESAAEHTGQS